jgi:hypothetical protein
MLKAQARLAVFLLILFILSAPVVFADGMSLRFNANESAWDLISENEQLCVISYDNGVQNMLLSIYLAPGELTGENAVWLFPVPANPLDVAIDINKEFPSFTGVDIQYSAAEKLSDAFMLMRYTQGYPYILFRYPLFVRRKAGTLVPGSMGEGSATVETEEVTVHSKVEKMGLTTELISATDGNAFHDYLSTKGLNLAEAHISLLDSYIGQDYSFVVAYVSDLDQFKAETEAIWWNGVDDYERSHFEWEVEYFVEENNWDEITAAKYINQVYGTDVIPIVNMASLSITFPTERMYYPLKPTSLYGSKIVPATIVVLGHVTPDLYPNIENTSEVEYYISGEYHPAENLRWLFNGESEVHDLQYTKISLNPEASALTEDLWIDPSTPLSVSMANLVYEHSTALALILFALCSVLASMIASVIIYRRNTSKKLALWGLWNFSTLVGFIVATKFFLKAKKKLRFSLLFTFLFVGLTLGLEFILTAAVH